MNKKLNLAVAAAVMAMGASAANAGIVIPAGDWTIDINGNVNAFYIHNSSSDSNVVAGGLANTKSVTSSGSDASSVNTGLLPSWLGFTGKTRQNDLDVSWTISFQPGASATKALSGGSASEFRQANLTFGDKSWGTIKLGNDLGVFGADAILNDQTLLGVGAQGGTVTGGTTTTLGRIGTGFLYADFTGQVDYTTPNWSGFQATVGIAQPWTEQAVGGGLATTGTQSEPAWEGVASYSWAGDFSGKVWLEGFTQNVDGITVAAVQSSTRANVFGVGTSVNFSGVNLVGYYYNGEGVGTTALLNGGLSATGAKRDSDGGYVQASFKIPGVGTKLAASWGESNLDLAGGEVNATLVKSNEMITVGAYHPLTSSVNLVAEYSRVESSSQQGQKNTSDIIDFGAILFF